MGVLKLLRTGRWRAPRDLKVEAPDEPVASAQARVRHHGGPADTEALDDLKTLERRYGPGVAPSAMRLRNAVLLHRAGHKEESWAAFAKLLADPELGGSPELRPALMSEIYSKMRVALEREGCHNAAVTPAVLAYATRLQFYALQGHGAALAAIRTKKRFDGHFGPLLARARVATALPALRSLVDDHLQALPDLDVAALETWVNELCLKPPTPPAPKRPHG